MNVRDFRFVITGAAQGIGAATARVAAAAGARVMLSDIDDAAGEANAAAIREGGADAHYVHCDVTNEDQIRALMAAADEKLGGIDVLHNNAGVHESMIDENISLESMSRATFERILQINLCLLYTSPSPRDLSTSRMPSSA